MNDVMIRNDGMSLCSFHIASPLGDHPMAPLLGECHEVQAFRRFGNGSPAVLSWNHEMSRDEAIQKGSKIFKATFRPPIRCA